MTVSGEKLDVTGDGDGLRLVADNPSPGLAALRLGKSFKKRPVLRDVSLYVQRGEAVGLLGPNGAGKTTTFYIMTGLIRPDHGTITLDGHDITGLPMYRRARLGLGYLPPESSEEHKSELPPLMRQSYADCCLKKKKKK